jgi:preprotein translocase subunit SecF
MKKLKFHIPFIKYQWVMIGISLFLMFAGLFIIFKQGFNYGIDFKGGVKLTYKFASTVSEAPVRNALKAGGIEGADVVRYGEPQDNRMVVKVSLPEEHAELGRQITAALENSFGKNQISLESEETVGPRVGKELRKKAFLAVIFAVILMLVYIGYRFDFYFAPGAVIALIHDVIITMAFFAFLNKEFNISTLAALLTIVGYSINDTIIVYDRIRENRHMISPDTIKDAVNTSINQTFARTIITVLTVLFVLFAIFFKGGGTLHDFAFAMIVGFIAGTYSSIFIASPCYIGMYRLMPRLKHLFGSR